MFILIFIIKTEKACCTADACLGLVSSSNHYRGINIKYFTSFILRPHGIFYSRYQDQFLI